MEVHATLTKLLPLNERSYRFVLARMSMNKEGTIRLLQRISIPVIIIVLGRSCIEFAAANAAIRFISMVSGGNNDAMVCCFQGINGDQQILQI